MSDLRLLAWHELGRDDAREDLDQYGLTMSLETMDAIRESATDDYQHEYASGYANVILGAWRKLQP
jgi:hypothetical protein